MNEGKNTKCETCHVLHPEAFSTEILQTQRHIYGTLKHENTARGRKLFISCWKFRRDCVCVSTVDNIDADKQTMDVILLLNLQYLMQHAVSRSRYTSRSWPWGERMWFCPWAVDVIGLWTYAHTLWTNVFVVLIFTTRLFLSSSTRKTKRSYYKTWNKDHHLVGVLYDLWENDPSGVSVWWFGSNSAGQFLKTP